MGREEGSPSRGLANPPPHPQPREAEGEEQGRGGFGDDGGVLQLEIEAAARELDRLLAPHLESEAAAEH